LHSARSSSSCSPMRRAAASSRGRVLSATSIRAAASSRSNWLLLNLIYARVQVLCRLTVFVGVLPGMHSFNGGKFGTLFLAPGPHAIQLDYFQVLPSCRSPAPLVADHHRLGPHSCPSATDIIAASLQHRAHLVSLSANAACQDQRKVGSAPAARSGHPVDRLAASSG